MIDSRGGASLLFSWVLLLSSIPTLSGYDVSEDLAEWHDGSRGRPVPVALYGPSPELTPGPLPLVLISHGYGESRTSYGYLARHLAGEGYLVVAVNHNGSDADAVHSGETFGQPGGPILVDRPLDLQFVLDRVESADTGSPLIDGRVDLSRIGVAGHSLGSTSALAMVGLGLQLQGTDVSFTDSRVKAVVAMSPQVGGAVEPVEPDCSDYGLHADSWAAIERSVMLMWGTNDYGLCTLGENPELRELVWDAIDAEHTYRVVIEGAAHHAFTETFPWYGGAKRDARHHDWISLAVTAFFDARLSKNGKAQRWLDVAELETLTDGEVRVDHKSSLVAPGVLAALETETFQAEAGRYRTADIDMLVLNDPERQKELQLRITLPDGKGAHPVIVYSHHSGGTKDSYATLMRHWASHGFVCIRPNHADSPQVGGQSGADAIAAWQERAADIRFIIDSLTTLEGLDPQLNGRLDTARIGVAGHYLGAYTVGFLAGATNEWGIDLYDPRVGSTLLLSPQGTGQGLTEDSWAGISMPMMVTTGSDDPSGRTGNPPEWRTEPFLFASPGSKYLAFIEGLSSNYGGLVSDAGGPETSTAGYVLQVTTEFWRTTLARDKQSRAALEPAHWEALSAGAVTLSTK